MHYTIFYTLIGWFEKVLLCLHAARRLFRARVPPSTGMPFLSTSNGCLPLVEKLKG